MNKKIARRGLSWEKKKSLWGWFFILPWLIGALFFFLVPMGQTVAYALCKIRVTPDGFQMDYVGFSNIMNFFTTDPQFLPNLANTILGVFPQLILIISFSLFVAVLLKEKFHGRTLARALFFFPVIIASGIVITILKENIMATGAEIANAGGTTYLFKAPDYTEFFMELGLPHQVLQTLAGIINMMFDLTWKAGVQILLLLAAINSIPSSSYEVANIEGATEWEKFWKITFPLVSPSLFVAVIYTIIDSFTDYGNAIMTTILNYSNRGNYSYSAAVGLIYFVCILLIIGLVTLLLRKGIHYEND